jgi:hypothetical protein
MLSGSQTRPAIRSEAAGFSAGFELSGVCALSWGDAGEWLLV